MPARHAPWSGMVALLAAAAIVGATHDGDPCTSNGQPALGIVQITTFLAGGSQIGGTNPDGVFYVDDRNYVSGNGIWIYEETNGIYARENTPEQNLQRGGCPALDLVMCEGMDNCQQYGDWWPDLNWW